MIEYTAEYLVAHNSHELTAHQLVTTRREMIELSRRHDAAIASIRAQLTDAERIGLAVMRAYHAGRKTVRIAELIEKGTMGSWESAGMITDPHEATYRMKCPECRELIEIGDMIRPSRIEGGSWVHEECE